MAISDYYGPLVHQATTETPDGRGGVVITHSDVNIQGCINQASSQQVEYARKLQIEATHNLYYPIDITLNIKDRIADGTKVYEIVSEPLNTVKRNHHFRVLLKRVVT